MFYLVFAVNFACNVKAAEKFSKGKIDCEGRVTH